MASYVLVLLVQLVAEFPPALVLWEVLLGERNLYAVEPPLKGTSVLRTFCYVPIISSRYEIYPLNEDTSLYTTLYQVTKVFTYIVRGLPL